MRPICRVVVFGLAVLRVVPAMAQEAVAAVYPSGPTVPANLLGISVQFAEPPRGPGRLDLSLAGVALAGARSAFVDQDLWTADGRTLTLLFDPARLKTGVGANATLGRVLHAGERITLTLRGVPTKTWDVTDAQAGQLDPRRWTITRPDRAEAATPLVIRFDHPVDALDRGLIAVVSPEGDAVPGEAVLLDGEGAWEFRPAAPWRAGVFRIAISPDLEDSSGNTVSEPFEVDRQTRQTPAAIPQTPTFRIA